MKDYGYKTTDSGAMGKTFERDLKAAFNQKAVVAKQGKIDFRRFYKCFEVKTGAGELDFILKSKLKYVIFVPVVDMSRDVQEQEGFVFDREVFIQMLYDVGLVRNKISSAGIQKVTIQTFWNHTKRSPHGKKYYFLLDQCYDKNIITLEEYFDCKGRF